VYVVYLTTENLFLRCCRCFCLYFEEILAGIWMGIETDHARDSGISGVHYGGC